MSTSRAARQRLNRAVEAQHFLDKVGHESAVRTQQRHLIGISDQEPQAMRDGASRRLKTSDDQLVDQVQHFRGCERVPLLFAVYQT